MARFLLVTSRKRFHLSHLDYPSDSQQWRTQHVCLFWDWLLLESNLDSLLTSILFRFRRDKYTRWSLLVTVHCLAMQDWLYFLNVLVLLESTRNSENSSDSNNIETFSFVLHLLPELISIFQSTNAEHWRIPSSSQLTNIQCCRVAFSCIHQ